LLDDVFLQQAVRHPQGAGFGIEAALIAVITVVAVEIADSPRRFDKDLKFPGRLSHHSSHPSRAGLSIPGLKPILKRGKGNWGDPSVTGF
jgi:hypothetical protein